MKRVTMQDVAVKAGKTRKAVSSILNNTNTVNVSQATRDKVLKIARDLNYRPNHFARMLKSGRTNLVGVTTFENLYDFLHVPYVAEIISGLGNYLAEFDQKVIFQGFQEVPEYTPANELTANRLVDGLVYLVFSNKWELFKNEELPRLKKLNVPAVVIHSTEEDLGFPGIGLDCTAGGKLAAEHFLEHGYASYGYVATETHRSFHSGLTGSFEQALNTAGCRVAPEHIFRTDHINAPGGYKLAQLILDRKAGLPRALFVPDDEVARGMIQCFNERGIRVPEDLAVIGTGDNIVHTSRINQLTTVRQPAREKGELAGKMLHAMMERPDRTGKPDLRKLVPTLTIRNSCGCNRY